jgi:hypothetical protein
MDFKYILPLQCCKLAKETKLVFLRFSTEYPKLPKGSKDDDNETYIGYKPSWYCLGTHPKYDCTYSIEVKSCPFCKTDVPDVELNITNKKIHDGDHDYCNTCGERVSNCGCLPPQWRWKPIGYDIKIP